MIESANYLDNIKNKLTKKRYIYQFIPTKLKDLIINKRKILYKGKNLKPGYLVDILHNMLIKYYSYSENKFNLNSEILRERYGTWYNYYMTYLIDNEIISLKSNYYVGKKSKTYTIVKEVIDSGTSRYKNYDKVLLKKYKHGILSNETTQANYSYISPDIRQKLINDLFYVDVDINKALVHLEDIDQKNYNKNKYSIEAIKNEHIFYHFDNYGRMHTNFTILKSLIRKNCLTIDGEETAEVDIKNSQPLFLTAMIDNLKGADVDKDEYKFFKDLTIDGNLYKHFMDNLNINTKRAVKLLIYKVLFGKNLDDSANKKFKSLFPNIHTFIILYKKSADDYRSLAYELQRSESNLVFNNIIQQIMIEDPKIKLFTVHDSIVYAKKHKPIVEKIFYDNLKKIFKY